MQKEIRGGFLISQIKQIQGRVFERLLGKAGIEEYNGAQGRILYVLWKQDNLPIVELSKRTGLAKSTLTNMLDRMEAQGHIQRNFGSSDRRQIRIMLTDKARKMSGDFELVSDQMSAIFYKGFSGVEIDQFENQLKRILKNLEEEEKQYE